MRLKTGLQSWGVFLHLWATDRATFDLIRKIRAQRLTYLDVKALKDIQDAVKAVVKHNVNGSIIEAGCALGGSALMLGKTKEPTRELALYDVFGMIPPPSERDGADVYQRYQLISSGQSTGIGGDVYYGYQPDLLKRVIQTFHEYGLPPEQHHIRFVQGLYQDTLQVHGPVALAHLDCDWYDSVMVCLQRIEPHLAVGGKMIIDDYHSWSGCRRAVDDYFAGRARDYAWTMHSRLHLTRLR